jgi:hypothetical protein
MSVRREERRDLATGAERNGCLVDVDFRHPNGERECVTSLLKFATQHTRELLGRVVSVCLATACVTACGRVATAPSPSEDAGWVTVPLPSSGSILTCQDGYAHPSICCEPAPYASPQCRETVDEPFAPCPTGWLTLPDPTLCCSWTDPTRCGAPSDTDAQSPLACWFPCGPGGYLPSSLPTGSPAIGFAPDCTDADGGCIYCCNGPGGAVCSGSQPGSGPFCPPCPSGWSVPRGGQIDVCCRPSDASVPACFTSANAVVAPP